MGAFQSLGVFLGTPPWSGASTKKFILGEGCHSSVGHVVCLLCGGYGISQSFVCHMSCCL